MGSRLYPLEGHCCCFLFTPFGSSQPVLRVEGDLDLYRLEVLVPLVPTTSIVFVAQQTNMMGYILILYCLVLFAV